MEIRERINPTVRDIRPSGIRRFFNIVSEMKDVISLGIGEPDFVTPWHICDAGIYSLEKGITCYTANAGLLELRREICKYLERRFGLGYDPATQVVVTVGGSEAIDLAVRTLIRPGDEVIIPEPCFVCYDAIVRLAGGVPVPVSTDMEHDFALTPEALEAAVTDKTRLVILSYPNNPTGAIMGRAELEAVAEVIRRHDLMVISDEIYGELTYGSEGHVSVASLPDMYDRTVVVNGFSKTYAMTGWRMGYATGHPEIIAAMTKIHQFAIMSAPTQSQYAAIEALKSGDADIERMRDEYDARRRLITEGLIAAGLSCYVPRGAFYVFPCIRSTEMTSEEFAEKLLHEKRVAVVPGDAFGACGEGFVRLSYAASVENITEALRRITEFVAEHKK
ncbi:MAG: aminotransferase class I/II-fold pyridoxal phosphate-dependent enzyme [Clostridia bacterium]|nr:aminotransferase class I/II-fold pyridoxal phosphate-dependent enzyme [Clostridia bacterium]